MASSLLCRPIPTLLIFLVLLLAACAPSCDPAVVETGFVARVSQIESGIANKQPPHSNPSLTVLYDERIPLHIQLKATSRLLNRYGERITLADISLEQRVWLRGQLETRAGKHYVHLVELRLP